MAAKLALEQCLMNLIQFRWLLDHGLTNCADLGPSPGNAPASKATVFLCLASPTGHDMNDRASHVL